jgi:hypothetical protein|tara:strand:- start:797 stop:1129 length:333 start_codon:yes stop_codon:yes gene_type:complete
MGGEKKGLLEKMRYDFPTEAVLEVQIKGTWYRVTSREFRSFDGHRRLTKPVQQPGLGMKNLDELEFVTHDCDFLPLYMFGSNKEVVKTWNEKMVATPYYEKTNATSASRG